MATETVEPLLKIGLGGFTAMTFRQRVGERFRFHGTLPDGTLSQEPAQIELLEVSESKGASTNRPAEWRTPFSLIFVLRDGTLATNGLCRMAHDDFEPADLLLSRIALLERRLGTEQYYEAVFG